MHDLHYAVLCSSISSLRQHETEICDRGSTKCERKFKQHKQVYWVYVCLSLVKLHFWNYILYIIFFKRQDSQTEEHGLFNGSVSTCDERVPIPCISVRPIRHYFKVSDTGGGRRYLPLILKEKKEKKSAIE